jgi:hypothetical protein
MTAKEVYLHLAEVCERTAATVHLPETKVGMLASAAVWRRLAADFKPWGEAGSNTDRTRPPNRSCPRSFGGALARRDVRGSVFLLRKLVMKSCPEWWANSPTVSRHPVRMQVRPSCRP